MKAQHKRRLRQKMKYVLYSVNFTPEAERHILTRNGKTAWGR